MNLRPPGIALWVYSALAFASILILESCQTTLLSALYSSALSRGILCSNMRCNGITVGLRDRKHENRSTPGWLGTVTRVNFLFAQLSSYVTSCT
jgi:hypothetical protein